MFDKFSINAGYSSDNNESRAGSDFEETSCFCLKRTFFVRKWFIHLVHWPWFERLSMLVILVNCTCMALADPLDRACSETKCQRLKKVNVFVLWFFVAEMIVKMTAMGVIGKHSYLSDGWNRLDFLIVVAGIVDEFSYLDGAFLVAIRLVRVLRPLGAINRVPSIRILVTLLLEALPLLGNVFTLAFLVLFIFGIVGVQLWQGVLRNRCFLNKTLLDNINFTDSSSVSCYYQPREDQKDFLCSLPSDSGMQHCSDMPAQSPCLLHSPLPSGNYCLSETAHSSFVFNNSKFRCSEDGPNPFFETLSFDNIGLAWLAIFQIITLEGWTEIMYLIQETHDYWNWIYFVILILIGPFFLINLCLVVLAMQFRETKSRELQLLEEDRQKKLEAQKVFKQSKWGKVVDLMKTNISESLHRQSESTDHHVHHHHHFHHYYHHQHHLQTPASSRQDTVVSMTTELGDSPQIPTVVVSHEGTPIHSPPAFHIEQEPTDSVISLELTSNCKITKNFLSPNLSYSGRLSPTCSVDSVAGCCRSSDAVSTCSCEDVPSGSSFSELASASATVSVNVSSNQVHLSSDQPSDTDASPKTEVIASATANASVKTEKVAKINIQDCKKRPEESLQTSDKASPNSLRNLKNKNVTDNVISSASISTKQASNRNAQDCKSRPVDSPIENTKMFSGSALKKSKNYSMEVLRTLNVSTLSDDIKKPPSKNKLEQQNIEVYRKSEHSESSERKDKLISNTAIQRKESQAGLDDRFGSMFDIQRYGQYYVSQDRTRLQKLRQICAKLANNTSFINFIMVVILINTITMAMEHYQQPESLDEFLEISNLFFISIFFTEMIIKIFGEGIRVYLGQWFNIFDGFIVIISMTEVIILRGGDGNLSVLRSIRLLRIFRLIRPIRHQLIVMVHTMASVVTFTALLFLFVFTFAVLGMNLFGGKMTLPTSDCRRVENVRSNFDTFLSAMVTIFQVLTLEDWNVVMQNAMRSTSHWAAVYFITLTVIGYYVLFNLLVAILVEGFTNPLLFDSNGDELEGQHVEQQETVEARPTTDWLALIKRANEQSSVPQSAPLEKDEDDFDAIEDLEAEAETSLSEARRVTEIFPTPSSYCGPAVRGAIGKSYQFGTLRRKPENSYSVAVRSANFNQIGKNEDSNILKSKAVTLVELKKQRAKECVSKTHHSLFRKQPSRLDHRLSRNNNGFCHDDDSGGVLRQIVKPRVVIASEDETDGAHLDKTRQQGRQGHQGSRSSGQQESPDAKNSKSLFMFPETNKLRQLMIKISSSKWFDYFILLLIVVSCIFMILDQPNTHQTRLSYIASFIFTVLFTVEVLIKVIAQGLVIGKDSYLRLGWNVLDFIIIIISWLHIIITSFGSTSPGILGSVKVLRALRTLRPLRMIRRAPGLKLVVEALLRSLEPIGNTVLIAGIFFVVFGVLGVQLFKGTFYHCEGNPQVETKQNCSESKQGTWTNRLYNFDNLGQALVILFVLATRDGWVTVMHHGVDSVGVDQQPKLNHNEWKAIYFVGFLMVVGFLVLNMVVGIVVNNYQLCQEKQDKSERKDRKRSHHDSSMVIEDKTRYDPLGGLRPSSLRGRCFRLCHSKYWDFAIAFVICVNVILMSLEHYKMSKNYELFLDINNYVCTAIFILEASIKLTAYGCRCYFQDRWNILDFLVVLLSVAGITLDLIHDAMKLSVKPIVVRSLRILRIVRDKKVIVHRITMQKFKEVLKLFKVAKGVRSLLDTVTNSLPQVANLGILLFLLFFIYSSLGMQLFGTIECSKQYPCHGLDSHANFRDFQTAMLTLFRVATGDNWNTIFMDTLRSACDPSVSCEKNCCFSKYVAPLYFMTFVLATHFVLLNVLVAVLMKDLKASREKLDAVLTRESLDKRVLKLTLSATKFMKQKAFSKKSRNLDSSAKQEIELKQVRNTLPWDGNPQR